jgi:hypothetical protein
MSASTTPRVVRTVLGHAGGPDYAIRDKQLYRDFRTDTSFWQLMVFAACGVELSVTNSELLDTLMVCSYVPEPRVWPIKLARLMAAHGHMSTGFGAAAQVVDSNILGIRIPKLAASLLLDLDRALSTQSETPAATVMEAFFESTPRIPGFGVPARSQDERVAAYRLSLAERPNSFGKYLKLAEQAADFLKSSRGVESNIVVWIAATCLDIGCSVEDVDPLAMLLLVMPMLATAHEGAQQDSALMRELPADASRYVGRPPRESPRKRAAQGG